MVPTMLLRKKLSCSDSYTVNVLDFSWCFCVSKSGSAQGRGYKISATTPTAFHTVCAPFRYFTIKSTHFMFEINVLFHLCSKFYLTLMVSNQLCWRQVYQMVTIIIGTNFTDGNVLSNFDSFLFLFQNHPT